MFHYCPSCASSRIRFESEQRFTCPDCGFVYFHNNAAATGCIINTEKGILFVKRAKDPAKGKLGLPGGFVNPGEGAIEGIRRECVEEIGFDPGKDVSFFASFPNVYPYKDIIYHTCDLYFTFSIPHLPDLKIDPDEIQSICFIEPAEIDLDEIAFEATRKVIQLFLKTI